MAPLKDLNRALFFY